MYCLELAGKLVYEKSATRYASGLPTAVRDNDEGDKYDHNIDFTEEKKKDEQDQGDVTGEENSNDEDHPIHFEVFVR